MCKLLRCYSSSGWLLPLTFFSLLLPLEMFVYHMSLSKQSSLCGSSYLCILNWQRLWMFKAVFKKGRLFVVMCFRILGFSPVTKGTESQISLYIPLNAKHRTSNSIKAQWRKEWQKLRETKVFCFVSKMISWI